MKDTWLATAPRLVALLAAALAAAGVVRAEVVMAVVATAAVAAIENATAAVDVVTLLGKKPPTPSIDVQAFNFSAATALLVAAVVVDTVAVSVVGTAVVVVAAAVRPAM